MRKKLKIISGSLVVLLILYVLLPYRYSSNNSIDIPKNIIEYCKSNDYKYCIAIDYSQPSKNNRLGVYDIAQNKIIYYCKCAHGAGSGNGTTLESFSNEIGSNKSSLGKYKIGKKRFLRSIDGNIDISALKIPCYELYGIDESNSNAYKRGILLHAAPTMTTLPVAIPFWHSLGCFSVPSSSFKKLSEYIDSD